MGYTLQLAARGLLYYYIHHTTVGIVHAMVFVIPIMEHWLEQEVAQWVHQEGLNVPP